MCGYERSVNLEWRELVFESCLSKCGNVKSQQISSQQALLPASNPRCCASDSSAVIIPGIRFHTAATCEWSMIMPCAVVLLPCDSEQCGQVGCAVGAAAPAPAISLMSRALQPLLAPHPELGTTMP